MNHIQPILDDIIVGKKEFAIDIIDDGGHCVGKLRPLVLEHLNCEDVINKLTLWRNINKKSFLTQFVATPERTRNWMRSSLFVNRGQMLFLIYVDDLIVGHFGFKDLTADDVLLDNAMRGERDGDPKLLVYAGKALVKWLFTQANVKRIKGVVMADNIPSLMMNNRIGFGHKTRHPLLKSVSGLDTSWIIGEEGEVSPNDQYCFRLFIHNHEFSEE